MKSVLLRLREVQDSITGTGQDIARYIRSHAEEVVGMNVRQVAEATYTSPSSVIRVCKSIGFYGYKDFHQALTMEVAAFGEEPVHKEREISREDSIAQIMEKVTDRNIQSLTDTLRLLSPESVEQCVSLIWHARNILLFGIGASLCVARDAYLKFLRLNKPCILNDDWHSQLLQARNASPSDVAIVFSYSGQTVEMIQCMRELKQRGTPCIAITRYSPTPVTQLADYVLYTSANESLFRSGAMSSRLSQLNVVDILFSALSNSDTNSFLEQLTRTHIVKPDEKRTDA